MKSHINGVVIMLCYARNNTKTFALSKVTQGAPNFRANARTTSISLRWLVNQAEVEEDNVAFFASDRMELQEILIMGVAV